MSSVPPSQPEPVPARTAAALRPVFIHVALLLAVANFVAILDRNSLSYAALTMGSSLHLSPAVIGLGFSCFTIGYTLFDIPSGLAYARYGAALWLCRIMITWGLVTAGMALITGPWGLYLTRFLLGAAEAGFITGMVLMIRTWFPLEYRARALSWGLIANPLAGIVAGPLAIGLFRLDGVGGLAGWQWLFIIEAIPAVAIGLVFLRLNGIGPENAPWLAPSARATLAAIRKAEDDNPATPIGPKLADALRYPRFWLLGLAYAGSLGPLVTLNHWTPLIVRDLGFSVSATGFVAVIPQVSGLIGMLLLAGLADRRRNPRDFVAAALVLTATGLAIAAFVDSAWIKLAGLAVAGFSVYAASPIFWSIPAALFGTKTGGGGFAFVSAWGVGGLAVTQSLIGFVREETGSYNAGVALIMALAILAAGIVLVIVPRDLLRPDGDREAFWRR